MKLTKRVLAGMAATVLALSMMVGTAFAASSASWSDAGSVTHSWDVNSAGYQNDAWVKLIGGGTIVSDEDTAHSVTKVVANFKGEGSATINLIYNYDGGWETVASQSGEFSGEFKIEANINGSNTTYCEVITQVGDIIGTLDLVNYEFLDASGKTVFTVGDKAAAASTTAASTSTTATSTAATSTTATTTKTETTTAKDNNKTTAPTTETIATQPAAASTTNSTTSATLPKTGVVSTVVVLGLGATAFGTGATLLKKKED